MLEKESALSGLPIQVFVNEICYPETSSDTNRILPDQTSRHHDPVKLAHKTNYGTTF
jgi:hypothetical protein